MNQPTLFALVVKLAAQQEATLPATQGHHAHGALLAIIRAVDPVLAAGLHGGEGRRPFTVGPLRGTTPAGRGQVRVWPGQAVELRLTLLDPALFDAFLQRFLWAAQAFRPAIRLGPAGFIVTEVLATPEGHAWSGYSSFPQLLQQANDDPNVELRFESPTAFSRNVDGKKRFWLFPDPVSVFDSLSGSWNTFGGPEIDRPALRERLGEQVIITQYQCQSEMLHFPRHRQIGFEGQAGYQIAGRDADFCRQLQALAEFAFYAGVGYKTTMGMGQCRRISR